MACPQNHSAFVANAKAPLEPLSAGAREKFSEANVFFCGQLLGSVQDHQIHAPIQRAAFGRGVRGNGALARVAR